MKKLILLLSVCFGTIILSSINVSAYVAVGTGAAIIGSIWPLIVAFFIAVSGFFVKVFWSPIKRFFTSSKKTGKKKNKK